MSLVLAGRKLKGAYSLVRLKNPKQLQKTGARLFPGSQQLPNRVAGKRLIAKRLFL